MIRVYNNRIREETDLEAAEKFAEARCTLIREHALHCGLTLRCLANVPDVEEAYDGDFVQATRMLSDLLAWGVGGLRAVATTRTEQLELLDLYGVRIPVECTEISEQAARAQEATEQPDDLLNKRLPKNERLEARVRQYTDGLG